MLWESITIWLFRGSRARPNFLERYPDVHFRLGSQRESELNREKSAALIKSIRPDSYPMD